jgi:transcriptional regulator with XRE-family HTH domain
VTIPHGNIIGERVKAARKRSTPPMTQIDLVARLHLNGFTHFDQAKISRIENGTRPVLDWEVAALADALEMSADALLGR